MVNMILMIFSQLSKNFIMIQILYPLMNMNGVLLTKFVVRKGIKIWCIIVGTILGLKSYLLGLEHVPRESGDEYQPVLRRQRAGVLNQEENPGGGRVFEILPYRRKSCFPLRITIFLTLVVVTLIMVFALLMFGPLVLGQWGLRRAFRLYTGKEEPVNDIISAWLLGACIIFAPVNIAYGAFTFFNANYLRVCNVSFEQFVGRVKVWSRQVGDFIVVGFLGLVVLPCAVGIYTSHVIIEPFRTTGREDTLVFITNDWLLGLLMQKVIIVGAILAPQEWILRNWFLELYNDGRPNLIKMFEATIQIINFLFASWAIPYVFGQMIFPLMFSEGEFLRKLQTTLAPTSLALIGGFMIAKLHLRWFATMILRLKEERYRVGNRLINRLRNREGDGN